MSLRYLSLFSGLEAAHLAWQPLGWTCAAVAEIDPPACAVLAHRLPGVPNLGDVSQIGDRQIAALGHIDVVIGGSPCQDLSVAGKRAGLAGARSGLFHEQLRIFHAARTLCGARWLIWENVPGAFSSNAGRDFGVVVGAMAGCELDVPPDGWGSEGVALGGAGLVEWSVLDAQWFGVAQRRRRVFAVLDTGDWASRPPVLLEPDSLRGDSPPRREAGEGVARSSGRSSAGRGEGWPADVASTLNAAFGSKQGLEDQHALGGGRCSSLPQVSACLTTGTGQRFDPETETLIPTIGGGFDVAHTLRGEGFDASEDGTGRGTPLVPVAFSCKDHGADAGELSPTLRAMGHGASHANAGGQVAVAFDWQSGGDARGLDPKDTAQLQRCQVPAVAFQEAQTGLREYETAGTLRANGPGHDPVGTRIREGMSVRRLTPREAERLQGAPDNWTLVPNAKGKPMADGPRYKMIGNSFAVPVIRWIGERIQAAHAHSEAEVA